MSQHLTFNPLHFESLSSNIAKNASHFGRNTVQTKCQYNKRMFDFKKIIHRFNVQRTVLNNIQCD